MKAIKKIKEYYLLNEIGRGTFGKVYEAISEKTDKIYAIKAISADLYSDESVMDQLKKELKLLYSIDHKNIIRIIGVEKTINNIYLILEHCNGGSLLDFLTNYKKLFKKNLPEKIIKKIMKQIIEGLKFMHSQNIIHRDIKLENILIHFENIDNEYNNFQKTNNNQNPKNNTDNNTESNNNFNSEEKDKEKEKSELNDFIFKRSGSNYLKKIYSNKNFFNENFTVKIADLGYAKEFDRRIGSSSICGTPLFMAPDIINLFNEEIKQSKSYNLSVDIWSLGTVFYELLIGKPPFIANFNKDIFQKILNGLYELPRNLEISVEAISLMTGLMNYSPEKRMNFEDIENEPFMKKDFEDFHLIPLKALDLSESEGSRDFNNSNNFNSIKVDSKNRNLFLKKILKIFFEKRKDNDNDNDYYNSIDIEQLNDNEVNKEIKKIIAKKEKFKFDIEIERKKINNKEEEEDDKNIFKNLEKLNKVF